MGWGASTLSHLPPVGSLPAPASDFSILLPWNLLQGHHHLGTRVHIAPAVWQVWGRCHRSAWGSKARSPQSQMGIS